MRRYISVFASVATAAAFLVPVSALAATINVPGDQPTIQAAVNAASSGDTITVAAGVYAEHVAVNKSLTITGANAGVAGNVLRGPESIVDGSDTDAAFAITANNVTINGFTVKNGSNGGFDAGIWSQTGTQNSNIINNIITSNAFGVWAQCGGTCLIQNNLFDGNNKVGTGAGSASISADSTTGLTINNNEFKNDTAGNPILMQAVAPGAHTNLVVSNNNFHNNSSSNAYILAVTGGTFSGNTITPASDATGISFSGADKNITVTGNIITGGARGVRVEDAGYYPSAGANSNITVNRNNVSSESGYGVGNTDAAITNLNASCNWWGAANGPGPVGPGSGSPVTTNVTFANWLTTSDLSVDAPCTGTTTPQTVTVTIAKYLNGVAANANNASSTSFSMHAIFPGGEGDYALGPVGFNNPNPYQATTGDMPTGSNYSTFENLTTSCTAGNPYALVGYSTGDTLAGAAASSSPTSNVPSFTNLQGNKFVVVWNKTCPVVATTTLKVHILKYIDGAKATSTPGNYQFPMTATWDAANLNGGATSTGTYVLGNNHGGAPDLYGADTAAMQAPANYSTAEITDNSSQVLPTDSSCVAGKYRLLGYKTSATSFANAATQSTTSAASFFNLSSDRYVLVLNTFCQATTTTGGTGSISGIKFEDWDADKSPYESKWEIKLGGWTIYLDSNNNGALDSGEPTAVTNGQGAYSFTGLAAGTYHVREVQKAGWVGITPMSGKYDVTLGAGQNVKNKDFGNFKLGSISGMKFEDKNGNHKKDAGEAGLQGWTINITGPNGFASSTVTDSNGNYSFSGLKQGTYKLSEVMQTGWKQTLHPKKVVVNSQTNAVKKNFGNKHKNTGNPKVDKDDGQDWEMDD